MASIYHQHLQAVVRDNSEKRRLDLMTRPLARAVHSGSGRFQRVMDHLRVAITLKAIGSENFKRS